MNSISSEFLLNHYPSILYLRAKAKTKIPHFAWEYLDSGVGLECAIKRNRTALDKILLVPRILRSHLQPDLTTQLFDQTYSAPFGIAPIGMSGMIWPGAELMLAKTAKSQGIPYCLSTLGCKTIEDVAQISGKNTWFQLYPTNDSGINDDLIHRAQSAGCRALIVTVDVPTPSIRERQRRAGLFESKTLSTKKIINILMRPHWAFATLRKGKPTCKSLIPYLKNHDVNDVSQYIEKLNLGLTSWTDLTKIRKAWTGPLVLKGLLNKNEIDAVIDHGVDGIIVSNQGARQLDGAPPTISVLPGMVQNAKGRIKIMIDSGILDSLDIVRALRSGADFVFCGRSFMYGVGSLQQAGSNHVATLLRFSLENIMTHLGINSLAELRREGNC